MMYNAWNSIEEVLYCFSRSSVKFRGYTGQKNLRFESNLSKITRPVAAIKSLRFALFWASLVKLPSGECDWEELMMGQYCFRYSEKHQAIILTIVDSVDHTTFHGPVSQHFTCLLTPSLLYKHIDHIYTEQHKKLKKHLKKIWPGCLRVNQHVDCFIITVNIERCHSDNLPMTPVVSFPGR